jgi:hypothetical protein
MPAFQKRLAYFLIAVLLTVVALGLRAIWGYLPHFINIWIGDFLWAMMLYFFGIALFLPANKYRFTLGLVVFCWLVEGSQAWHTPQLDAFRDTTFGGLLLGHGFLWSDIVSYTAGAVAGYVLDSWTGAFKVQRARE